MIGETLDADLALNLAENAKNLIESDRPWLMLIKEDSSETFGSGETYLTQKNLPADFLEDYKVFLGDSSINDFNQYAAIPFHMRRKYNDSGRKYYIDWANQKIHICDKVDKTYTIYLYYVYQTPALNITDSDPVWPAKFRPLISYTMAELFQLGVDYDDITARQALEHNKQAKLLFDAMVQWDTRLKLKSMNGRAGFASENNNDFRTNFIPD
ncbi:MAG: hypothetical protein ABIJ12_06280 [bacterium]